MRGFPVALAMGLLALSASPALTSPAVARELLLPLGGKAATYATPDEAGGTVPSVGRGQPLGIACNDASDAGAQVRVVMKVAGDGDETPTGYDRVLLTQWKISHGTVHVRVPDVPGLANHTVSVKVFVVEPRGTHICDVGRVKVS